MPISSAVFGRSHSVKEGSIRYEIAFDFAIWRVHLSGSFDCHDKHGSSRVYCGTIDL